MLFFEELQPLAPDLFWILCLAFVIAFLLAFSVGANDVSNSFGTSVGSRVLTVTQACILATFFEMAGATLLGYSVCDTFRRKMYNVEQYEGAQKELMLGALACLIGSSLWNLLATFLKMPISGTHSIVGATIGFSVVLRGWDSIRWVDMARIVASWFASPLLSGLISSCIYVLISKTIIKKVDPLRYGLKALPLFYGATIFINVASIVIDGPEVLGLNTLPWYAGLFIALMCACCAICYVALVLVPRFRDEILGELVARKACTVQQQLRAKRAVESNGPGSRLQTLAAAAARQGGAYDNVTFAPDDPAPQKPRRGAEGPSAAATVTLNQGKLAASRSATEKGPTPLPNTSGAEPGGRDRRPTVAPKPAHLRRQLASDHMDDIDLGDARGDGWRDVEAPPPTGPDSGAHGSRLPQGGARPSEPTGASITATGERYEVAKLFASLQILTACFASFAHGTNDVSNAVAPLIPIWNIYTTGREDVAVSTQIWILAFGSIGICTGLWAWGRAVMATISDGLTKITPSKGFSIELGAAISVLVATKLGLPISTTHCKVGSLVIVGFVSSRFLSQDNLLGQMQPPAGMRMRYIDEGAPGGQGNGKQELQIVDCVEENSANKAEQVDWKLFGNIALTWVSTVPMAALASAGVMYLLRWLVL